MLGLAGGVKRGPKLGRIRQIKRKNGIKRGTGKRRMKNEGNRG